MLSYEIEESRNQRYLYQGCWNGDELGMDLDGVFEVVWILGLNVRIPPRCNPLQNPEAAGALT